MRLVTLLSLGVLSGAGIALCLASTAQVYLEQEGNTLPVISLASMQGTNTVTVLRDRAGTVMSELSSDYRKPILYIDMPPLLVQAFISAEDKDFWKHDGINPIAIMRAGLFDVTNHGHRQLGASTITQQVVKNLLLDNTRTVDRKVREALLAVRLEQMIPKTKILELYLNNIYLGYGSYGIKAAASVYAPGKDLKELTLGQIAFLAGLPKGPSNYDPQKYPDAARQRRAYVLSRMLEDGVITQEQMQAALDEPLPKPKPLSTSGVSRGWYQEAVRRQLVQQYGKAVYQQGLDIRTDMDPMIQDLATRALQTGLEAYDRRHGWHGSLQHGVGQAPDVPLGVRAGWVIGYVQSETEAGWNVNVDDGSRTKTLSIQRASNRWAGHGPRRGDYVLVDPDHNTLEQVPQVEGAVVVEDAKTGQVLADVGGYTNIAGGFDRAIQSERQPGSTLKPFIYLSAFEAGYTPSDLVLDVPISIEQGDGSLWEPGGDGDNGWGPISIRRAIEYSRNMASVRLVYDLGLDTFSAITRDFGIYQSPLKDYADALGARETTLLHLTNGYAEIANGGYALTPTFIGAVNGVNVLAPPPGNPIAPAPALAALDDVLHSVVTSGTAARAFSGASENVHGKTGTSNDIRDAWFIGYRGHYVIGIHVGYDTPQSLGRHEMGGQLAAPIARTIFDGLPQDNYRPYATITPDKTPLQNQPAVTQNRSTQDALAGANQTDENDDDDEDQTGQETPTPNEDSKQSAQAKGPVLMSSPGFVMEGNEATTKQ